MLHKRVFEKCVCFVVDSVSFLLNHGMVLIFVVVFVVCLVMYVISILCSDDFNL